jgi:hypothetical protein
MIKFFKKSKEISEINFSIPMHILHSLVDLEKFSVSPVFKSLCDLLSVSLLLILWKHAFPKSKEKDYVLNLSDNRRK